MSVQRMERTMFETSRAAEYFDARELQAQTGQPRYEFATVVLKELLDNALDAAETAGVAPEVNVEVSAVGGLITLTVTDNGCGIPAKTIHKILNFNTRTSDKAAYRTPTRGAQGNALKTVLGIPQALGGTEPVVITAHGVRHSIRAWIDPAGVLRIEHGEEQVNGQYGSGTQVQLSVPAEDQDFYPEHWTQAFALFNPHLLVKTGVSGSLSYRANTDEDKISDSYHPTASFPGEFRKFLPTDLPSPHWYDLSSFKKLIFSHIADTHNGGEDPLLRDFVRTFRGLSASAKAKSVCDRFPDIKRLSGFERHEELVGKLLSFIQTEAQPPKPTILGLVGKEHFQAHFEERYGIKRFWYKKTTAEVDGTPFAFEVAVAETEVSNGLFTGVNFSPTFDDPLSDTGLKTEEFTAYGIEGFLEDAHASPYDNNIVVAAHLVTPAPEFLDRGKTRLKVHGTVASAISEAMWGATKTLYKEEEKRRRDAARQAKAARNRQRNPEDREPSLKDAVFAVLEEAVEKATGGGSLPTSARNLYYQVRPLIQLYTSKELEYTYFSQDLLTQYQEEHAPIEGLYYDPRGILYEPHTGEAVPLGTREVDAYTFPVLLYDKILYVEKKGLWPILQQVRLAERYDMAVVAAEGYASSAARVLFANAETDRDYQLFVLHDADPHGYNIARTLREETARMPGYSVDVIDLGLGLEEALDMGLQEEEFTRKKKLPESLLPRLSETEFAYFKGRPAGPKSWICKRIELNAMTSPQLVEYIERKLEEAESRGKVVPLEGELPGLTDEAARQQVGLWVEDMLEEILSVKDIKKRVADQFLGAIETDQAERWINEGFAKDRSLSWRTVLTNKLHELLCEQHHTAALNQHLRQLVADAIEGGQP